MIEEYFCIECGGMVHGEKKISCMCGPKLYTEQDRDEFAMKFARWFSDRHYNTCFTDEELLEQFKAKA